MGIRPNLVVGAVGIVAFLITGSFIVSHWRELTETKTYAARVDVLSDRGTDRRYGEVGVGGTRSEPYLINHPNVTSVHWKLTWTEAAAPAAQHRVTIQVRDPQGNTLFQPALSGEGGIGGIPIEKTLRAAPPGARFSSTPEALEARYDDRYPNVTETQGTWLVTIQTDTPSGLGAQGIQYTLTKEEVRYYVVSLEAVAETLR